MNIVILYPQNEVIYQSQPELLVTKMIQRRNLCGFSLNWMPSYTAVFVEVDQSSTGPPWRGLNFSMEQARTFHGNTFSKIATCMDKD